MMDLIGVPFKYGGRGPDYYDCWGLVMEGYKRIHGVEIPDYRSSADMLRNESLILSEGKRLWKSVEPGKVGSVTLFSYLGFKCHVGIVHKPRRFLHTMKELGGVHEGKLRNYEQNTIGFYEYVGS